MMRSMKKGNPTSASASPEVRLLLACGRRPRAPESARLLEDALAGPEIDWHSFHVLARGHGLAPLARAHLAEHPAVPQPAHEALEAEARDSARSNLVQSAILHGLVADLTAGGAAPLVLKGLPLGAALYGDPALRPCSDLDLLVRPAEVERAAAVLAERGYVLLEYYGPLTPRRLDALRRAGKHYHYEHPGTRSHVDLHWEAVSGAGLGRVHEHFWWGPPRAVPLDGRPVPVLDEARTLVQSAAHGGRHLWERLIWVVDAAEQLRLLHPEAVAEAFRLARSAGLHHHLLVAASLAVEGLQTPLPSATRLLIERASAHPAGRETLRTARGLAFERALSAPTGTTRRMAARAAGNGGLPTAAWRTLEHALTPSPSDWRALSLPDRLFPLYHLIRPPRIALKYTSRFLHRFGRT